MTPLIRGRFLGALEFPDSARGMEDYANHLKLAEESDPSRHDELARKFAGAGRSVGGISRRT